MLKKKNKKINKQPPIFSILREQSRQKSPGVCIRKIGRKNLLYMNFCSLWLLLKVYLAFFLFKYVLRRKHPEELDGSPIWQKRLCNHFQHGIKSRFFHKRRVEKKFFSCSILFYMNWWRSMFSSLGIYLEMYIYLNRHFLQVSTQEFWQFWTDWSIFSSEMLHSVSCILSQILHTAVKITPPRNKNHYYLLFFLLQLFHASEFFKC